jgi:3-oxoacyl-[acyl-carrier protein] reductase
MSESKTAVVFGATGAVGSSLARTLSSQGWTLMLSGRDSARTEALADELGAAAYVGDITQASTVSTCVEQAKDRFGKVDGVVNCVGSILLKPAHLTTDEEWDDVIQLNLTSAFATVRAGAKAMQKSGGSIVLVSSAAARVGLVNHEAIAAAKAGVEGLTLSAASTYASRGIRVNAVAPGLVESRMTERMTASAESLKVSAAMHPIGRIGKPGDVASAIAWLLSAENDWITGQVIGVDGGLSTLRGRTRVA